MQIFWGLLIYLGNLCTQRGARTHDPKIKSCMLPCHSLPRPSQTGIPLECRFFLKNFILHGFRRGLESTNCLSHNQIPSFSDSFENPGLCPLGVPRPYSLTPSIQDGCHTGWRLCQFLSLSWPWYLKKVPVPGQLICRMCLPFFQEEPGEMLGLTFTKSSAAENGDEGQQTEG